MGLLPGYCIEISGEIKEIFSTVEHELQFSGQYFYSRLIF